MIALIDYKAGNLTSVRKALAAIGASVFTPESADELKRASAVIVPGVGHFSATRALDTPWMEALRKIAADGRPLLGICLGLQWLFNGSEEAPDCPGLDLLEGRCYRLSGGQTSNGGGSSPIKVPHVGWNVLTHTRDDSIVQDVPSGSQVYFTHSYVAPVTRDTVSATEHGERFASIVQRGNVAGVQFHPEKSGDVGLQILRNFLGLIGRS